MKARNQRTVKKEELKQLLCTAAITLIIVLAVGAIGNYVYTRYFRQATFNVAVGELTYSYHGTYQTLDDGRWVMNGKGTLTLISDDPTVPTDGICCSGTWERGRLVSEATLAFPEGAGTYVGEVDERYIPTGEGTFYFSNEELEPLYSDNWIWLEGEALSDDEHTIDTINRVFYTGMCMDGVAKSGYGSTYSISNDGNFNQSFTGEYRDGKCVGVVVDVWQSFYKIIDRCNMDGVRDTENVEFRYLNTERKSVFGSYRYIDENDKVELFDGFGAVIAGAEIDGKLLSGCIDLKLPSDDGKSENCRYYGTFSPDGKIVGDGIFRFRDGTELETKNASWISSQTRSNGVYTGMIVDDKYTGFGKFVFSDGDVYTGEYTNGERNGYGEYVSADGTSYYGYWVDGKLTD